LLFVRATLLFGCAACLMAQTDSQADSQADSQTEYGGPAILSRGEAPGAKNAPIAFRPYIGINGIVDNGILPVSVNENGQIPISDVYGVELSLGAYTYHTWKHTTLALDYRGNFRHYSQSTNYDGTDQYLSLILTHQPSKRIIFSLREQAGTYSRGYFLPSAYGILEPAYLQLPQNDIYDNRVVFLNTAASVTFQKSARLSFNFGGEGDLVRRQSSALYGTTGGIARADVQYRVTRHSTIGVDYLFNHFSFTQGFGNSTIHSVGLNYSTQLTRRVQLSVRAGGARVESSALTEVPLDPAVAAILGTSVGVQAAYHRNYVPDITARLSYTYQHSNFGLSYANNVNPGNGVYLTSRNQSAGGSYSYTGIRYWNFGVDGGFSRMSTLIQTLGVYKSYGGGIGVTRALGKSMHLVGRLDTRHYDVAGQTFLHNGFRATVGFSWSPGDIPLALW